MKKILIVNNNLDIGGIQKSLINLIKETHSDYNVTLLLLSPTGSLLKEVPADVKIITPSKVYSVLGLSKEELKKHPFLFVLKGLLTLYTKVFSRRCSMKLLGIFQKKITGYDVVISYSHLPHHKCFANGCGDFVLDKTKSNMKICMIHCDYSYPGYMTKENNREYDEFDKIACCSDSVKNKFVQGSLISSDKVHTLYNFYDLGVDELAMQNPYSYDEAYINLVSVARLSSEKGIDCAIEAIYNVNRSDIRYYIVGDGPQKVDLVEMVSKYKMENQVFFVGEQINPYGYMKNADYLLVSSLHEAAPMVFNEARILGLNIIATNTASAAEMIGENGVICDKGSEGIKSALLSVEKSVILPNEKLDNKKQKDQLENILRV